MSIMECDLRNERPERPGEFTFTWSVKNYSYFTEEEGQELLSPEFVVECLGKTRWWLKVIPRGYKAPGFVSSYLSLRDGEATCYFTLAIRMSNGQFKEGGEILSGLSERILGKGYSKFVSLEELKGSDGYLYNDTLTVRCRMWKTGVDIPASVKWEAHSRIKVSELEYTWILNDVLVYNEVLEKEFNKSVAITKFFTEGADINLHLFKEGSLGECSVQFGIEIINPKTAYFWKAVVYLIDADGNVVHCARGEHEFRRSVGFRRGEKLLWNFPLISEDDLCTNKKIYLPNNQLTLRCELSFAASHGKETFVFRKTNEWESTTLDKQSDLLEVWIKNMQECYKEGKFGDFLIRTPSRQFLVSRNILSAHSEVFDSIFDRDMKECKTGIVDIKDLDDETVLNMLEYVYTGTLDSIDFSIAQKLYSAAHKYKIAGLQKKCSIYLMRYMDDLSMSVLGI